MRIRRLTGYGRMEEGMRKGDVCINQAQYTTQHGKNTTVKRLLNEIFDRNIRFDENDKIKFLHKLIRIIAVIIQGI